jgi:hypothetical protein
MQALTAVVYVVAWVPLVLAGRRLGTRWGNRDAGVWLPVLLGPLGFAIFVAGSHPATQPRRLRDAARMRQVR